MLGLMRFMFPMEITPTEDLITFFFRFQSSLFKVDDDARSNRILTYFRRSL